MNHNATKILAVCLCASTSVALSCGDNEHNHNPDGDFSCDYESPIKLRSKTPAKGKRVGSLRVLTTNVFGQSQNSIGQFLFESDELCQSRLKRIGEYIRDATPAYDIVGFNEWHSDTLNTCNGVVLENRLNDLDSSSPSQLYAPSEGYKWSHHRWGQPEAHGQNDGGLGLYSRVPYLWQEYGSGEFHDVLIETENIHQFQPRLKPRTAHGFLFARIYQHYPDIAVDVYVVHIASTQSSPNECDDKCKAGMLGQLREGIHSRSAESGFPVLILGDFNIGGPNPTTDECAGSKGYGAIMENLGHPNDVWLSAHPDKEGGTYNWLGANPERIDFMFIPDDPYLTNSKYELMVSDPSSVLVIDWKDRLGLENPPDHRGLEATIEIRRRAEVLPSQR